MKHWNELTELESAIIRVGEFKNLFKLVVAGTENYVDIKVLQSAIYTLEGMIDDIDSTLYEKFQSVWDSVKYDISLEDSINLSAFDSNQSAMDNMFNSITITQINENQSTTTTSEEDEAFKELEKAIKNWHKSTP